MMALLKDSGQALYRAGRFAEAAAAYRAALDADPDDLDALAGSGAIALLHNRLDEARAALARVVEQSPTRLDAVVQLAEAAYRQDDFAAAALWWRRLAAQLDDVQRSHLEAAARKLDSFAGRTPYQVDGHTDAVRVPLDLADPLPILRVRLNDHDTASFFIDTGGHEVFVDQALADRLDLPAFGSTRITGGGGKTAAIGHSRLDALTLGELRVQNVPVTTMDLTEARIGGVAVQGVIGTAFLYHFLATIDFPGKALVLRPRSKEQVRDLEHLAEQDRQLTVPFWHSGTHFLLAWGRLNDGDPMLLFVDTGGSGIAFTGPKSTLDAAGVDLRHDEAYSDYAAGGATTIVPFAIDHLELGPASGRDLKGAYLPEAGEFLPDTVHEFSVGGIISHQFFLPYELTFDFTGMRLFLRKPPQ